MESLSVAGVLISKTLLQQSKYTEGVAMYMTGMNFVRLGKKKLWKPLTPQVCFPSVLFWIHTILHEWTPPLQCSICVVCDYVYFIFVCPAVNMSSPDDGADATNLSQPVAMCSWDVLHARMYWHLTPYSEIKYYLSATKSRTWQLFVDIWPCSIITGVAYLL